MNKRSGGSLLVTIIVCAISLGLFLRWVQHAAPADKPSPQVFVNNNLSTSLGAPVEQLLNYAVQHRLRLTMVHWPEGYYCMLLGDVRDAKYYRNGCEDTPDKAAQDILNDVHSSKPAPFDKQEEIELYNPNGGQK